MGHRNVDIDLLLPSLVHQETIGPREFGQQDEMVMRLSICMQLFEHTYLLDAINTCTPSKQILQEGFHFLFASVKSQAPDGR